MAQWPGLWKLCHLLSLQGQPSGQLPRVGQGTDCKASPALKETPPQAREKSADTEQEEGDLRWGLCCGSLRRWQAPHLCYWSLLACPVLGSLGSSSSVEPQVAERPEAVSCTNSALITRQCKNGHRRRSESRREEPLRTFARPNVDITSDTAAEDVLITHGPLIRVQSTTDKHTTC
jgi:hypothetical protein